MAQYRKKPVVIEAVQWDGQHIDDMMAFLVTGALDNPHIGTGTGFTPADGKLYIPTLEGTMTAEPGDWIIRGVAGEFYPIKNAIFRQTYEPV